MRHLQWIGRGLAGLLILGFASDLLASVPLQVPVQGVLRDNAGVPVVEDVFQLTFALYDGPEAQDALWTETWPPGDGDCLVDPTGCVHVQAGVFRVMLGAHAPLDSGVFAAGGDLWLGITVETDPELPRQRLGSSPYAIHAGSASALACTGCLEADALSAAARDALRTEAVGAVEALGYVTADGAIEAVGTVGYVTAEGAIEAVGTVGYVTANGAVDAVGPLGHVTAAEAVQAVEDAGFVKGADLVVGQNNLPANGLNEISNGLLSNEFDYVFTSAAPTPIKDNWPAGVANAIEVGDVGEAQGLTVSVTVENSDLTTVTVRLFDPEGVEHTLYAQNGPGQSLQATYPAPDEPISGDLGSWVGKNPLGTWILEVVDAGALNNLDDGEITTWSVAVNVLSNQKVAVEGDLEIQGAIKGAGLEVDGDLDLKNHHLVNGRFQLADAPPVTCDLAHQGYFYLDTVENALRVCIGNEFRRISTAICGDGVLEGGEQCDDANLVNDDGCNAVCAVEAGFDCVGSPTSVCSAICGDGVRIQAHEDCDDGNPLSNDGCNAACEVEDGWTCQGALTSVCSTVCGDGVVISPAEACDDDNQNVGDGCSNTCTIETGWSCAGAPLSLCSEICGDSITVGAEACDDGNLTECDGCSSQCNPAPNGYAYDSLCLVSNTSGDTGGDTYSLPDNCNPYVPARSFSSGDFELICEHFSPDTNCGNADGDADGGLCSNYSDVILSFEQNDTPDIWVHDDTFNWNPNDGGGNPGGKCNIISDSNTMLVFACQ